MYILHFVKLLQLYGNKFYNTVVFMEIGFKHKFSNKPCYEIGTELIITEAVTFILLIK